MPDRFKKVSDDLFRGGMPSKQDLKMLKDIWNVERIVSLDGLIGKDIDPYCKKLGLEHIILHIGDGTHENVSKLANEIVPDLDSKITYLHCRHGKDRTGMAIGMYRILNGWDLKDTLTEAFKMDMGKGLSSKVKQSYYDAVKSFASEDDNSSDVVSMARDRLQIDNQTTPFNDQSMPQYSRHSYFEYTDPKTDYLNRPASEDVSGIIKFAKKLYCKNPDNMKEVWYDSSDKIEGESYSANISSDAKIKKIEGKLDKEKLREAILSDVDVIEFNGVFVVINPEIMEDIEDINDVPMVGQHDNYTGVANYVFPGSGGGGASSFLESGYGGFAGAVILPNQTLEM